MQVNLALLPEMVGFSFEGSEVNGGAEILLGHVAAERVASVRSSFAAKCSCAARSPARSATSLWI